MISKTLYTVRIFLARNEGSLALRSFLRWGTVGREA